MKMLDKENKEVRAEVVLTPAASKRLIAKAVVQLECVQNALKNGIVVVSVGTTCLCILEEILQQKLTPVENYLSGIIIPGKLCLSSGARSNVKAQRHAPSWIFEKGKLVSKNLREILNLMSSSDVFIKGANALDSAGNAGVLIGGQTGGTIGLALSSINSRHINLVIPVGLEKLIPTPIEIAAKEAGIKKTSYSMGLCVGLMPLRGKIITEIEAIQILTGAKSIPIAAGGINGAEGSVVLVVKGSHEQVQKAFNIIESIKNEALPSFQSPQCKNCEMKEGEVVCPFAGKDY